MKIHEAKQAQSKKKSDCRNMSLQEAAVEYHLEDPMNHAELEALLQRVFADETLSNEDMEELEAYVKLLFRDYLEHLAALSVAPQSQPATTCFARTSPMSISY